MSSDNEDVQYGYPAGEERDYVFRSESTATVEGLIDEEGHLQTKDLWGVQQRLLTISLPAGTTLEDLQRNHRNGIYWDMSEEFKQQMRQIATSRNRKNAGPEDRVGNTGKMLIVGAKFMNHTSDCKKAFGLDIPGLVPEAGDGKRMFNYIVTPTNGNPCVMNAELSNPSDMMTRSMYEQKQKFDLATLKKAINLENPADPKTALMPTNNIGWKVLLKNMGEGGYFEDVADTVVRLNPSYFEQRVDPDEVHYAKVPVDVAKDVFKAIAKPLEDLEKCYVNLDEFRIKWVPVDGNAWTHAAGLINETAGQGFASEGAEKTAEISRPINAYVHVMLSYIMDE